MPSRSLSRTAVLALLFKLVVYGYLRVIPATLGKFVIPPLFLAYLVSCAFEARSAQPPVQVADKNGNADQNGDAPRPLAPQTFSADNLHRVLFTHDTPTIYLRLAAVSVNVLLLLCTIDFTLRPLYESHASLVFTRVGAVEPTRVKIIARYPNITDGLRILYRPLLDNNTSEWMSGPILEVDYEHDWTGVAMLRRLTPATEYQYTLAFANTSFLPLSPVVFRTFPDPRVSSGTKFRFISTSCILPNFPYTPFGGNRIEGLDLMTSFLDSSRGQNRESPIEFVLFLGDFIYADVPLHVGFSKEAYTRLYRRNYASSSLRQLSQRLPIFSTYDDHEISNNYVGEGNLSSAVFQSAIHPFEVYQSRANYDPIHKGQYYFDFAYADAAFFVLDTRAHRTSDGRTMLGDKQLQALHTWLGRVNSTSTYKFVISSVPFTTLWNGDAKRDSWAAFQEERASLLDIMSSVPNTFVLTGDRHEFAIVRHLGAFFGEVLEVSTSPLSMFWLPIPSPWKVRKQSRRVVHRAEDGWAPEETLLEHVSMGNFKWSVIEVDTTDSSSPRLSVELYTHGKLKLRRTYSGIPVTRRASTALGFQINHLFSTVVDRVATIGDPISKYLSG